MARSATATWSERPVLQSVTQPVPFLVGLYKGLTSLFKPAVMAFARHRLRKGKEDPHRLAERFGKASLPRPPGPIIWLHSASVGEAVSLLPLLKRVLPKQKEELVQTAEVI